MCCTSGILVFGRIQVGSTRLLAIMMVRVTFRCGSKRTEGLDVLLAKVQPRVCFFGHHHTRVDAEVEGVRCIGLNKVGRPGNLVAIDMEPGPGTRGWSLLGEFGGR